MSDAEFQETVKEAFIKCFSLPSQAEQENYLNELAQESSELADALRSLMGLVTTDSEVTGEGVVASGNELQTRNSDSREAEQCLDWSRKSLDTDEPEIFGPYRLLEKLGEGGMGAVYLAEQTSPILRRVAVKIIKAGMDTEQVVRRFEAERQTLAMMDHPSIARVLDAGATENGRPYFVMELVEGVSLTEFCKEQRMSMNERLKLFVDVCEGVKHAHRRGVIHRDLKPSNVLVAMREDKPSVKIIDFGIAKAINRDAVESTLHTSHSQFMGTPLYMSPEQAEHGEFDIDTRSDVYSLGVMLYELLTDTTPFSRDALKAGFDEIRRIIREVDPEKPSQRLTTNSGQASTLGSKRESDLRRVKHKLQGELDWIVMKALEKGRDRRYDSADALAEDIGRFLADRPVLACPPSWFYRSSKLYRKNRTAVLGTLAILASLVFGLTSTAIQWSRAERLAVEEAEQRDRAETLAATETAARKLSDARLYVSQINRAKTEWDYGNHIIAKRTLSATEPNLRKWEYFMLEQLFSADSLAVSEGHDGAVLTLQYSNDGQQIITGGNDGTIRYWDANTSKETRTIRAHTAAVNELILTASGETLISCSTDKTIKTWDFATGALQSEVEHSSAVNALAVSPDAKLLAFGGKDGSIKVLDRQTKKEVRSFEPDLGSVLCLAFSSDGNQLASGTDQNALDFWYLNEATAFDRTFDVLSTLVLGSPKGLLNRFDGHYRDVTSVQFTNFQFDEFGAIALSAGDDRLIRGWEYENGFEALFFAGHTKSVLDVQVGPDNHHFASAGADGTVRLWHFDVGLEVAQFREHLSEVRCVAFNNDGTRLASGGDDGKLVVWKTDQASIKGGWQYQDYYDGIVSSEFSPSGDRVLTVGKPKLFVWDSSSGKNVMSFDLEREAIVDAEWNPNGKEITLCYEGGILEFVDATDGVRRSIAETGLTVRSFTHLPNGDILLVLEDKIVLWEREKARAIQEWSTQDQAIDLWCDNEVLAYVTVTGQVSVRRHSTDAKIADLSIDASSQSWVSVSDDLRKLVVVNGDGRAYTWDIATGTLIQKFEIGESKLSAVKIDLSSNRVFIGSEDGVAQIWDLTSGQYLLSLSAFEAFEEPVSRIDFSQNRTKVLYAGDWGDAITWELATPQDPGSADPSKPELSQ